MQEIWPHLEKVVEYPPNCCVDVYIGEPNKEASCWSLSS